MRADDDVRLLFSDVEVKKITTNSRRDFLNIYIFSRHLIQKKQIFQMEQCIKDQLFAKTAVAVHIVEEYMLSGQYTAEALMNEYRESIILELKEKSMLASNMFAQADIRYEAENVVCLELLDTIVSAGRKEEIVDLLKEVYSERFHIPAEIRVDYKEPDRTGSREYDEQRIQQEINAIFERRARQRGETPQAEGEEKKDQIKRTSSENAADKASVSSRDGKGTSAAISGGVKKGEFKKGEFRKKDFYRPVKIGDDPNLIYGRNFEDEPISLEQVITEMGEITVHGKIISFDTREIRNEKTIIIFSVTDFTDTITVKMFAKNEQLPEILGELKKGAFVKVKGVTTIDKFDGELTIASVTGIKRSVILRFKGKI